MYLVLKKGVLRNILSKAFAKSGNIRLLASAVQISRSTLSSYHMEKTAVNQENLNRLLNYLHISIGDGEIIEKLDDNWGQIQGGKKCVQVKKRNGTYREQLKKCQKKAPEGIKLWHKKMKQENPEKYYLMQYEKFKKIGGYKFVTENGEKVRNKLEKQTADLLKSLNIHYKYESLVQINGKYFFPDFLINDNIIIECTEWRGFDKAIKLNVKINHLKEGYKIYVVIPKPLKRYYEILNHHLLLGIDDLKKVLYKSG